MRVLHIDSDNYYHHKFRSLSSPNVQWVFSKKTTDLEKKMREHQPDALLMELIHPNEHGFDVLKRIRNHPEHSLVPVIIFSRQDHIEDVQEAMRYGINGFFVKGRDSIDEVHKLVLTLS